ncbi:MAG: 30S ribosomal protein S7 [Candidatus Aenigmarchaeota archaeon]|nr:30S ribosomal protein S7 [Candidatus Aenigmarchaeota archaeon]
MATEVLAFARWPVTSITVSDPGLKDYINLTPKIVPRSGGRYAKARFHKSKTFIVERFMNKLMGVGHKARKHLLTSNRVTGKGQTVYGLMEEALKLVEQRTKQNPLAVLVKAIENAAPREEIITIEYGGAKYPKAVEVAPQRRIDSAMKYMTQGAYQKTFNSKKSATECLANEIIFASQMSNQSAAIAKKLELERQADSSR